MKKHATTVHGSLGEEIQKRHICNFKYPTHGLLYRDECKTEQAGLQKTEEVLGSSLARITALVSEVSWSFSAPSEISLWAVSSKSFIKFC
jgi:hypothetical protein